VIGNPNHEGSEFLVAFGKSINLVKLLSLFLRYEKLSLRFLFQGIKYRIASDLTNTDITMNKTLWLGIYPALGREQLDFIAEKIQ
jgi:dTDP-4-amino-4,6-dideoxygalactose transaminase